MSQTISLLQSSTDTRIKVLKKLGYSINSKGYVIDSITKEPLICIYSEENVHIDTAAILPGSTLIINANNLTMSQYFLEHGC